MTPIVKPLAVLIGLTLAGTAGANCTGNVTIGEGSSQIVTTVANKVAGKTCLNSLIIDTDAEGANYGNHGEFVSQLSKQVTEWVRQGIISLDEATRLRVAGCGCAFQRRQDPEGASDRLQ